MVVDRNSNVEFRTFAEQKKSPSFCLSWKMVESTVFRLQTTQTLQTVQTVQTLQFSCLLFTNSDLHMIQVWVSFSYSFGNVGTVSIFWTPWLNLTRIFRTHVTLQQFGRDRRLNFIEHVEISLTWQKMEIDEGRFYLNLPLFWNEF